MERFLPPTLVVVLGGWSATTYAVDGAVIPAVVTGALGLGLAWLVSPLRGRGGPRHAEVAASPDLADRVVVYWRPGCMYCERLRAVLGRHARDVSWVSIWADPDAAAYVRSVNGGDETVPTVLIGGEPRTNPAPAVVREALSR